MCGLRRGTRLALGLSTLPWLYVRSTASVQAIIGADKVALLFKQDA